MPPPISLLWLVQRTGTFTFVTPRTIILMVSFVSSMRMSRPPIATLPGSERHLLVPLSSLLHFLCFFFESITHFLCCLGLCKHSSVLSPLSLTIKLTMSEFHFLSLKDCLSGTFPKTFPVISGLQRLVMILTNNYQSLSTHSNN